MLKRASTRQSIENIHRYSPIPAIYKYPIEIFNEIFSMACTDSGKTGCSLSTVLKRIREVSKVFKYQTLWVKQTQLRPLAHVLHSLPLDARRVVHLYILSSNLWQPLFGYHYDHFFDIDKNRVLALVAHSLHTLKVVAYHPQFLLPIPLPSLWDLTLHGGIKVEKCTKRGKAYYPALECFQLFNFHHADEYNLFPLIMNNAPTLGMIKLSCGSFHMIEDFPEKPTSLKIVLCPCYWLIAHKWNHPMVERKDVHVAEAGHYSWEME